LQAVVVVRLVQLDQVVVVQVVYSMQLHNH
jgi:hypothetical protein